MGRQDVSLSKDTYHQAWHLSSLSETHVVCGGRREPTLAKLLLDLHTLTMHSLSPPPLSLSLSLCVCVSVCLSYVSNYLDLLLYNPEVSPGEERRQLSEALQVRF